MRVIVHKFNSDLFKQGVLTSYVKKQTKLLEEYADKELSAMATSHEFKNQTYNLQDSLVWIVYFNGEKRSYGFYGGGRAEENSYLHAWEKKDNMIPVNGRQSAQQFVDTYEPTLKQGWVVVWASTAPYGAYLENGSTPRGLVFRVISQEYDSIKQTLGTKCKVTFESKPVI